MAATNKLTDTAIKKIKSAGRHSDGGGLYLRVKGTGGKSWSFMWKRSGLQREIGLGSYPDTSLKLARSKAKTARKALAGNRDPRIALRPPEVRTFLDAAQGCMKARNLDTKNPKTKRKWERTALERCKHLHNRPIESITREDILKIIEPIWITTPETARIARSHLEIILNYAKGRQWITGDNPAQWKGGLEAVLTAPDRKNVRHHPAMDYADVPGFMAQLVERDAISARVLEFTILTGARTSEALEAVISEFDLKAAIWTVPAERMKPGREHKVPLSPRAVEIVKEMRAAPLSDYIFPGQKQNRPLSNLSMLMLLRRMKVTGVTVHGFRSSFRDWAGDCTNYSRDVAEAAISHAVGDAVERSYRRGDALEKRRGLMTLWADYCAGVHLGDVVQLHG